MIILRRKFDIINLYGILAIAACYSLALVLAVTDSRLTDLAPLVLGFSVKLLKNALIAGREL